MDVPAEKYSKDFYAEYRNDFLSRLTVIVDTYHSLTHSQSELNTEFYHKLFTIKENKNGQKSDQALIQELIYTTNKITDAPLGKTINDAAKAYLRNATDAYLAMAEIYYRDEVPAKKVDFYTYTMPKYVESIINWYELMTLIQNVKKFGKDGQYYRFLRYHNDILRTMQKIKDDANILSFETSDKQIAKNCVSYVDILIKIYKQYGRIPKIFSSSFVSLDIDYIQKIYDSSNFRTLFYDSDIVNYYNQKNFYDSLQPIKGIIMGNECKVHPKESKNIFSKILDTVSSKYYSAQGYSSVGSDVNGGSDNEILFYAMLIIFISVVLIVMYYVYKNYNQPVDDYKKINEYRSNTQNVTESSSDVKQNLDKDGNLNVQQQSLTY